MLAAEITSARGSASRRRTPSPTNLPKPLDWVDRRPDGAASPSSARQLGRLRTGSADRVLEPLDPERLVARRHRAGPRPDADPRPGRRVAEADHRSRRPLRPRDGQRHSAGRQSVVTRGRADPTSHRPPLALSTVRTTLARRLDASNDTPAGGLGLFRAGQGRGRCRSTSAATDSARRLRRAPRSPCGSGRWR